MPCRSDYMEPNPQEKEAKAVAKHIVYVYKARGLQGNTPEFVKDSYRDYYGKVKNLDELTKLLCSLIRAMLPDVLELIVYDGRNPEARALADWWEYHQKVDRKRKETEKTQVQRTMLKKSGLAKLTSQEKKALGL